MTYQGDKQGAGTSAQDALSQPDCVSHEVKATPTARSPRDVFEAAMSSPPMTPSELTAQECACRAEMARAERRRAPSPQGDLDLAA